MRAEGALDVAAEMADALRKLDLKAVLVGGMALVILGSRRVTRDFDFPVPAAEVAARATRMKIASQVLDVAAEADLLELKRIAAHARHVAGDADDIAFLEARLRAADGGKPAPRKSKPAM